MRSRKRNDNSILLKLIIVIVLLCLLIGGGVLAKSLLSKDSSDAPGAGGDGSSGSQSSDVTPTGEDSQETKDAIEELIASLTLREKICQMMIVHPSVLTGYTYVTSAGDATKEALAEYPVGGFIYDSTNLETVEQTTTMLNEVQALSEIPLFISVDEEGGNVSRVMEAFGSFDIGPMLSYKDNGPEKAKENAATIASSIKDLGFNLDFAPVADVLTNPDNYVIGDRAYSDDYQQAAELVSAAVEGFHQGGVGCTLKHFPGHGDSSEDSHLGSAYIYKTLDQLREGELLPFKAGIERGADMVMIGHLIVPDISSEPAVVSKDIVTGLLREELGFTGVIITDGLGMQAVSDYYTPGELAVKAVNAGVDLLLMPTDIAGTVEALEGAVESGDISMERIDESLRRILSYKSKWIGL